MTRNVLLFLLVLNLYIELYKSVPLPLPSPKVHNKILNSTEASKPVYRSDPLVRNLTACAHQTKATIRDVENYIKREKQVTIQGKCLTACMLKKVNVIRNNKLSPDNVIDYYSYAENTPLMRTLTNTLPECVKEAEVSPDVCFLASQFIECMNNKVGESVDDAKRNIIVDWDPDEVTKEEEDMINYIKRRL